MSQLATSECYSKNDVFTDVPPELSSTNVTTNNNMEDVAVKSELTSPTAEISTEKAEVTSSSTGVDEQGKTGDQAASRDEALAPAPASAEEATEPVEPAAVTSDTPASTE